MFCLVCTRQPCKSRPETDLPVCPNQCLSSLLGQSPSPLQLNLHLVDTCGWKQVVCPWWKLSRKYIDTIADVTAFVDRVTMTQRWLSFQHQILDLGRRSDLLLLARAVSYRNYTLPMIRTFMQKDLKVQLDLISVGVTAWILSSYTVLQPDELKMHSKESSMLRSTQIYIISFTGLNVYSYIIRDSPCK